MTRYGMVINLKRCIGCDTCTMVCKATNATSRGVVWNRVLKYETGKYPCSRQHFLPVTCMQCEEPECQKVCPTGATIKREDGIIVIDSAKCMGCRYCMVACPYAARYFLDKLHPNYPQHVTSYEKVNWEKYELGTVEKCNFCVERIERGLQPACIASCPTSARFFGDLDDPDSEVSKLVREKGSFVLNPELDTKPAVHYLTCD